MTRTVLAFGSNLGERAGTIRSALAALDAAGVRIVAVSSAYETDPVGGPDQPDYLNAVAVADTDLTPADLLAAAQSVEAQLGRVRAERWGPRTIDIDIVVYGDVVSDDPQLTLPHPRAAERAFVLLPWLELEPAAALPDGRTVEALLSGLDQTGVRRRGDASVQPA